MALLSRPSENTICFLKQMRFGMQIPNYKELAVVLRHIREVPTKNFLFYSTTHEKRVNVLRV